VGGTWLLCSEHGCGAGGSARARSEEQIHESSRSVSSRVSHEAGGHLCFSARLCLSREGGGKKAIEQPAPNLCRFYVNMGILFVCYI